MLRLCLTLMNAVKLQDDDVELVTEKPIILYERAPHPGRLFRDLAGFGFQAVAVPDARPYLNSLLVRQLLFLPVAMCNTTLGVFLSFPEGRELAAGLIARGVRGHGEGRAAHGAASESWTRGSWPRGWRGNRALSNPTLGCPDRGYNSLLQSLLKGKPTEAARLNRRIVEIASAAGLHSRGTGGYCRR